jgi:hypothetical protein
VAQVEDLEAPESIELADEERDKLEGLKEIVIGDHVKQEILVQAGDSEAIARRLSQRTQASMTYPAEEEDAKNIAGDSGELFDIEDELREQREEEAKARAAEIEAEGEASAKANKEAAAKGKGVVQQTMDAHKEAVDDDDDSLPRSHAELDEIAAREGVDLAEATSVADKQEAIRKARG